MHLFIKTLLAGIIFASAVGLALLLASNSPQPTRQAIEPAMAPVSIELAEYDSQALPVFSRGLVEPGRRVVIVSEVTGVIAKRYDAFTPGVPVRKGDPLVYVESQAYEVSLAKAQAQLIKAQRNLSSELAEIEDAQLVPNFDVSQGFRANQLKGAQFEINAAKAQIKRVKTQQAKQSIRAPFDGVVETRLVDQGQAVTEGVEIGKIYATDSLKVRLPLSDKDLAVLGINLESFSALDFEINLKLRFGNQDYYWDAKIDHFEAGLDPKNRLMYLVAKIITPYAADSVQPGRPILAPGHFMEAKIHGAPLADILTLPRQLLRYGDFVWVLDEARRIYQTDVEVVHKDKDFAYVRSKIPVGSAIVTTPMDIAIDGMKVKVANVAEGLLKGQYEPSDTPKLESPSIEAKEQKKEATSMDLNRSLKGEQQNLEHQLASTSTRSTLKSVPLPPLLREFR